MAEGKGVVVAGCVPQGDRGLVKRKPGRRRLCWMVSRPSASSSSGGSARPSRPRWGEVFHALGQGPLPSLELPKQRKEALVEIVPLSTGCLGACTYCKTRHARGKLGSYAPEAIERRISEALDEGVAESGSRRRTRAPTALIYKRLYQPCYCDSYRYLKKGPSHHGGWA